MTADEIKNRTVYMLCRTDKTEDDGADIYIGSTSNPLEKRLCEHRSRARKFIEYGCSKNNKLYTRMVTCGVMNWRMVPLLTFACDQTTIREFEKEWVKTTTADLNTNSPITNQKEYQAEYYKTNQEAIRQQQATYREVNKETIRQQKAKYYEANREAVLQQQTKYYEVNREEVLQRQAKYYKNNIQTKRYYCDVCDIACRSNRDLKNHLDTLKHSYAWLNAVD